MYKKIGIITHWRSKDNYGQTLQIYALQCVLKDLGVEPFLIRYYTSGPQRNFKQIVFRCFRLLNPVFLFNSIFTRIARMKIDRESAHHSRGIDEFINNNIQCSTYKYNRRQIVNNPPEFDYYITGSDQVWNKLDGTYFLDFVTNEAVCISYAASFGAADYQRYKEQAKVRSLLKKFKAIGVRERSGLDFCNKLGLDTVQLVPDPTLLLSKSFYQKMSINPRIKERFLLLYLLGNQNDLDLEEVFDFAKNNCLKVIFVPGQGQKIMNGACFPTLQEWLGLINCATYVVTNSFHGTVFSLIFNKAFLSVPASGKSARMNDRMLTLFNSLNVDLKFMSNDLNVLFEKYSWDKINNNILLNNLLGIDFLKYSLSL